MSLNVFLMSPLYIIFDFESINIILADRCQYLSAMNTAARHVST